MRRLLLSLSVLPLMAASPQLSGPVRFYTPPAGLADEAVRGAFRDYLSSRPDFLAPSPDAGAARIEAVAVHLDYTVDAQVIVRFVSKDTCAGDACDMAVLMRAKDGWRAVLQRKAATVDVGELPQPGVEGYADIIVDGFEHWRWSMADNRYRVTLEGSGDPVAAQEGVPVDPAMTKATLDSLTASIGSQVYIDPRAASLRGLPFGEPFADSSRPWLMVPARASGMCVPGKGCPVVLLVPRPMGKGWSARYLGYGLAAFLLNSNTHADHDGRRALGIVDDKGYAEWIWSAQDWNYVLNGTSYPSDVTPAP